MSVATNLGTSSSVGCHILIQARSYTEGSHVLSPSHSRATTRETGGTCLTQLTEGWF